jgi:hypothetical protein
VGLFQVLAAADAVALQNVLAAAVEASDHAVRLRAHRRGQAVLDAEVSAEAVEVVVSGGGTAAEAEQPVGELLPVAH